MLTGIPAILVLAGIGLLCSALLILAFNKFRSGDNEVVELILKELPQTQCAQCGYPGCRPYAEAIANGADINKCPPGGAETINALSRLLGKPAPPLDTTGGDGITRIATIREQDCIGCTLCLPACPVDAIIGAPQFLHAVLSKECTGCELCLAPCPVDCIDMLEVQESQTAVRMETSAPCIHCGDCIDACPRDLAPQQLYFHENSMDVLESLRLMDCIECGRCDQVCPSGIPLTQTFVAAKQRIAKKQEDIERAEAVRNRVDRHDQRMEQRIAVKSHPTDSAALIADVRSEP